MPKDRDEPDCLQKPFFFEETKSYLFLIAPPCFTRHHWAVCLPEVSHTLHMHVYMRVCMHDSSSEYKYLCTYVREYCRAVNFDFLLFLFKGCRAEIFQHFPVM